MIYKILAKSEWDAAKQQGRFSGSAVDIDDGFIHFSSATQVKETAAKHFAQQSDLILLGFDEDDLGDDLKWERSRNDQLFPHLYQALDTTLVKSIDELPLDENGQHRFPELVD